MKKAILHFRTNQESEQTAAATMACNYLMGLDKKHLAAFQDKNLDRDLVEQVRDFWLKHQHEGLDKIVILWDRQSQFPFEFINSIEPAINTSLMDADKHDSVVTVECVILMQGETKPPGVQEMRHSKTIAIDVIYVGPDVAADYVFQMGVSLGVFQPLPYDKDILFMRLHRAADLLDGGRTLGAYTYGIFTLGMANRLSGRTQKARQLRALANAIFNDKSFEIDHGDAPQDRDYEEKRVEYYMEKEYGKAELQRKRVYLPFMSANETLSVNSLAADRRHPWLDWMLGRSANVTTTAKKLGIKPEEHQVRGPKK